jgi:hypothetical protein
VPVNLTLNGAITPSVGERWFLYNVQFTPYLYFSKLLRDRSVAKDATWLAVFKRLGQFKGRSSRRTWIFRTLTNRAKTRAKREVRSVPFSTLAGKTVQETAQRAQQTSLVWLHVGVLFRIVTLQRGPFHGSEGLCSLNISLLIAVVDSFQDSALLRQPLPGTNFLLRLAKHSV